MGSARLLRNNGCCPVCRRAALRVLSYPPPPHRDTIPNRGPTQSQADLEQGFVGPWLGDGVDAQSFPLNSLDRFPSRITASFPSPALLPLARKCVPSPPSTQLMPRRHHVLVGFCSNEGACSILSFYHHLVSFFPLTYCNICEQRPDTLTANTSSTMT
ncbi:hypothetical protein BDZ89DRAFT_717983 [Hymenopellis radicata]|nr:hypothetical protein BDZ89DRAFT_717983 [Hymenopellis radicata]